ncbi:MAG: hypothetical protein LBW85_04675 [Deltaproteobacteria bacterium]|jgi:hypothetical protein|nr:hypothetical protein [Deltaproteobacteria bacterium]
MKTLPEPLRPWGRSGGLAVAIPALILTAALGLAGAPALRAQEARDPQGAPEALEPGISGPSEPSEREKLDLTTIATLSVGLIIQSYGYIGVYGDLLSSGAYDSNQVINMLGDTVKYLSNAHRELVRYQDPAFNVTQGDRQYLAEVAEIVTLLIGEAESLRAYAQSRADDDLSKFRRARDTVLSRIQRLIRP